MSTRICVIVALVAMLFGTGRIAYGQTFTVNITVDENGHGTLTNSAGFSGALPAAMRPDPGPGGLPAALTYDLLNPPGMVAGDLLLLEGTTGQLSDVLRFNPTQIGPGGGTGCLVFYSDNQDGGEDLADTGFPAAFYPNSLTRTEVGPEGNNGFTYTPVAGQPGFVANAGGPVTYVFNSDVPEPASLSLLCGLCGALVLRRRA